MLRTELSEMRKSVEKQDNSPYPATAIPVQTESTAVTAKRIGSMYIANKN